MEGRVSTTGDGSTEPATATAVTADPAAMAAARERAGRQGLLFDDDLPHLPEDMGYRGPTACAAAGITYRQLDYWARTGLVEPGIRSAHGSGSQRLYSFRDILVLKVVKRLLDTGVSLQNIRTAVSHLRERGVDDLAQITLMSDGASVYECTSPDEVVDLVHGGGAFSGKDPSKVDRSAAYAMRWVAKNVVAAGLAERCEVQVAYAIGKAHPVGLFVETFGTETVPVEKIQDAVGEVFDLRPAAIIRDLELLRPIYAQTAAYGHFGRELEDFTWERTDRVDALRAITGV